jgi:two-component system, NarL family, sensor kinase
MVTLARDQGGRDERETRGHGDGVAVDRHVAGRDVPAGDSPKTDAAMSAFRRAAEPLGEANTSLIAGASVSAWLLLIAAFTVFRLFLGRRILPTSAVELAMVSILVALVVLAVSPWGPTRRSVDRILGWSIPTAVALAVYLVVAPVLLIFDDDAAWEVALTATCWFGLIAQPPVRALGQRRVESLLFGGRGNPYRVIAQLGQRLEITALPEAVLPGVVDTVARALRLSYVAIELESATGPVVMASTGDTRGPVTRLPLVHQAQGIGWLVVGRPSPGDRLTPAERRLLEHLASQISVAARAVQLMHDLEQSRALVVIARDEERRRLQRNLHDGLGPMLAGINLTVQAARNLVRSDPGQAEALLADVIVETRAATEDIRGLIDDLRPPVLDRLGLVAALHEQVSRLGTPGNGDGGEPVAVVIEVSQDLRGLPPAVELAAFRIALEAFVNVWRHANARRCEIRFTLDSALHIEVIDDGSGIPADVRPGVGMSSMQERAMELGGTCSIVSPDGGGTHLYALLPIPSIPRNDSSRPVPAVTSPGSSGPWPHDDGTQRRQQ